jgi:hypothetical protein
MIYDFRFRMAIFDLAASNRNIPAKNDYSVQNDLREGPIYLSASNASGL